MQARTPEQTADLAAPRPKLGAVLRHLGLSLLWANVVPGVLFYACFRAGNLWTALIAALTWCYGSMAWRMTTGRRTSGLLWLTAFGLTAKTIVTMVTGDAALYFVQPAVNDSLVAVLFLLSLRTARPVVARLAHDFYPLDDDVASRPGVQKLFWRLTLLWAGICAIKACATIWLLESVRLSTYVAVKTVLTPSIALTGAAVTVVIAVRVARHEGLLHATA